MATHRTGTLAGVNGVTLFTQTWQPDGATRGALVLIHGFGEHSGRYGYLVDALTAKGYAIYSMDQRGHGQTAGQRGHVMAFDEFTDDVGALVATARGATSGAPVFLFGHSLGGLIALNYAIRRPEGLSGVIASAPLLSQAKLSPALYTAARTLSKIWPGFALDTGLKPDTISRDAAEVVRYRDDPLVDGKASARLGTEIERVQTWTQAHAGDLKLPLLLYHGTGDQLVSIEGSRTFYAHVTLADKEWVEWEGGYHESHNDTHRAEVFGLLITWLERHRR